MMHYAGIIFGGLPVRSIGPSDRVWDLHTAIEQCILHQVQHREETMCFDDLVGQF
jgi:hypothetical protein